MAAYFKKTQNEMSNFTKALLIVLLFCLAHAVVCFLTHNSSFGDGLFLTILTIAMVYALIRFYKAPFDVFLGITFLSCFAGFYLGTEGAALLENNFPGLGIWINVITTSSVTALLGLVIIFLVRKNWNKTQK